MSGRELRRIRLRLGLTQQQMAQEVGVADGNVISRFERGRRRIDGPLALLLRHIDSGCKLHRPRKR